jgi:putative oxidoreductase
MATHAIHHPNFVETDTLPLHGAQALRYAVPFGRLLFTAMFLLSSISLIGGNGIQHAAAQGVPFASIAVPIAGVLALLGGLSVLLGYHARIGALLIVLFLVPVTLMMHRFWNLSDPQQTMFQQVHFMKNTALLGAALMIGYFGAGPISIDAKRSHAP